MNLKNRQKAEYGESTIPNSELEEDRLVPLELRGAAKEPSNLCPEPRTSAGTTTPSGGCRRGQGQEGELLENTGLRRSVHPGAARQKMVTDWTR
jgi:hypothetical protein